MSNTVEGWGGRRVAPCASVTRRPPLIRAAASSQFLKDSLKSAIGDETPEARKLTTGSRPRPKLPGHRSDVKPRARPLILLVTATQWAERCATLLRRKHHLRALSTQARLSPRRPRPGHPFGRGVGGTSSPRALPEVIVPAAGWVGTPDLLCPGGVRGTDAVSAR